MSQISLKSISGITSITTPAGVDNRFSLYNFDSTERLVLDHSGNLNISGVTTATNFKTGSTNVHSVGVEAAGINVLGADTPIGAGATIYNSGAAVFTGVVTATQFKGDGSNLSGLASREFYGFKAVNEDLVLIHTNNGADNISKSDFESFEDTMTAPSGLSFAINSAGELEMTI
tara:strand:+ start:237 stop:758 length:522 start_codon:yes stop_codon:yes gene_type:complete